MLTPIVIYAIVKMVILQIREDLQKVPPLEEYEAFW